MATGLSRLVKWFRGLSYRTQVKIGLIVVMLALAGGYFTVVNPYGTEFHFSSGYPYPDSEEPDHYNVYMIGLRDVNLSISFVNDTNLWFSIDVELYEPSLKSNAFEVTLDTSTTWLHLTFKGKTRIKSIDVVLGGTKAPIIYISGVNVNCSVVYSNGVQLGDLEGFGRGWFIFDATGKMYFTLLEDVDISKGGLDVYIGRYMMNSPYPSVVCMYVDLPSDLDGCIYLMDPSDEKRIRYSFYANDGWYYRGGAGYAKYSTKYTSNYKLEIRLNADYAYLYLYD